MLPVLIALEIAPPLTAIITASIVFGHLVREATRKTGRDRL